MNEFDKSYISLVYRLLFVQGIVLLLFLLGSILVNSKVKEEIANSTAITLRSYLLEGDFRSAVTSAELSSRDKFNKVVFVDSRNSKEYVLTSEKANFYGESGNRIFQELMRQKTINIYYGSDQTSTLGSITFYYEMFDYIPWAILIWLVGILLSYPVLSVGKMKIKKEIELRKDAALTDAARKLGHDIWAPIGVIEKLLTIMPDLHPTKKSILENAFFRLKDVVNEFMIDNKKILSRHDVNLENSINLNADDQLVVDLFDVEEIITSIIQEKNFLLQDKPGIKINFIKPKEKIFLKVSKSEFSRMLSNILQNSIEAIDNLGSVDVNLNEDKDQLFLSINDSGKGIDSSQISRIGEKGFSFDKENGNGLGLYFVKKTVESWAGNFRIFSSKGVGTKIEILIPTQM